MVPNISELKSIVKAASKIIDNNNIEIHHKHGFENIVTSSDLAIQTYLKEQLAKLIPGSAFLCEEDDIHEFDDKEFVWIIDPIDGTMNYSRRIPEYCISTALMHNSEIVMGVVYNPANNQLFSAERGNGAFLNDEPIHVSNRRYEDGILCTAMSLYKKQYASACSDIIYEAYMQCNDIRRIGSCALELCYIAMGYYELYFEFRVMPWDYAAAHLVLTEAGGILTGFDGERLTHRLPTLLVGANNPESHKRLSDIVTKHIKAKGYSYEWNEW